MNHQNRNILSQKHLEKEDKHGKKVGLDTIPIQKSPKKSLRNVSNHRINVRKSNPESDHGRFDQGIRNALTI